MNPQKSEIRATVDRFVADIAAIIRRHAERVVADVLARRGLGPTAAPSRRRSKARPKPKRKPAAERGGPLSVRRPEQLSLF